MHGWQGFGTTGSRQLLVQLTPLVAEVTTTANTKLPLPTLTLMVLAVVEPIMLAPPALLSKDH
jgi:hypothetical protein